MDTHLCSAPFPAAPLLRLVPGEVHRLAGRLRGARLVVQRGRLWVTQAGSLDDHFLAAGGELLLRATGAVVLECEGAEPAELRVLHAGERASRRSQVAFAAHLRRVVRHLLKSLPLETRPTAVLPRLRRTP